MPMLHLFTREKLLDKGNTLFLSLPPLPALASGVLSPYHLFQNLKKKKNESGS